MRESPWWYRRRDFVFGLVYFAGFFLGGILSTGREHQYVPLFVYAGSRFANGIEVFVWIAIALVVACYAIRVWGSSYLHADVVWSADARTDSLVIAGPFRYTRNPLYLGNVLMAAGFGVFATPAGFVILNVLSLAFIELLIRWEERGMRARYGAEFERYCKSVPQILPRITPVPQVGSTQPSLKEGFLSEIFVGCLVLGMITLFVSRSIYGWSIFVVLYVCGIVVQRIVAGRNMQTGQLS